MLGSSRTSLTQLGERLTACFDDPTQRPFLVAAGQGMLQVADAVDRERTLRNVWSDSSTPASLKLGILNDVFSGRINALALELTSEIISNRWSSPGDLIDAIEYAAATLLFMGAEQDNDIDRVEEELFRFGRYLAASADLQMALTDPATSAASKQEIVADLLDDKVAGITEELLVFAAGHLRGRRMSTAIDTLSEIAAVRRNRVVAEVTSAIGLTDDQIQRLTQVLTQIQGRPVVCNFIVDPTVVGGIEIRVGDEVIDGTLSTRLEQARRRLTS